MKIELDASTASADGGQPIEEIVQFVFRATASPRLMQRARQLLADAPRELNESFEQAMRGSGLAS